MAGTIAGNGDILGVAPNIGIRAYRVIGADGTGNEDSIVEGIIAATNDGVNVINMSLGGIFTKAQVYYTDPETGESTKLDDDVAEYLAYSRALKYAEEKGVLVVTSAGNDGVNASNPKEVTEQANLLYGQSGYEFIGASFYTPASIPNVINVSATGPNDELASYSNYGNGFIDVAAPGGNDEMLTAYQQAGKLDEYLEKHVYENEYILSSVPEISYQYDDDGNVINYSYEGPGYAWMLGTSQAAPKVSAIAALIYATNDGITPDKVKMKIEKTAEKIGENGHDEYFGYGLANAYNALTH